MASLDEIRNIRLQKIEELRKNGMDPYPVQSERDFTVAETIEKFDEIVASEKVIKMLGRIMALRSQGAIVFINFDDGSGKFQALFKKGEHISDEKFDLFNNTIDIGDFVQIEGVLFITKRGEKTIQVKDWKILSKSLRPLPEKWHGLQDMDERFRRRYLDILMSADVRERFVIRSKITTEIRQFLTKEGFLEVETPMLQAQAGGATALPFETHHNALDVDLFLRIAPELYLKKLLIAGLPKVFELGRNFRNEGIDMTHNPEFTMLEYYEAYSTADKQMDFAEKFLKTLVKNVFGKESFTFQGDEIDFSKPFSKVSYFDLLKNYTGLTDIGTMSRNDLATFAKQSDVNVSDSDASDKIMDNLYKKTCRPKLIQPTFIIDYPVDYLPLAKRSSKNQKFVDAFQLVIGGVEIVKAFSELNDPIDQASRFAGEEEKKKEGDEEAQSMDEEFLEAMEYGMPPAGGVGIGIDRLAMLLTDTRNIKEVIIFPTMKPKG